MPLRFSRWLFAACGLAILIIAGSQRHLPYDKALSAVETVADTIAVPKVPPLLQPGEAYDLPVSSTGVAECVLSFADDARYRLIVSSLDAGERRFNVALSMQSIDHPSAGELRIVPPLQPPVVVAGSMSIDPHPLTSERSIVPTDEHRSFFVHVTEGDLTDRRRYAKVDASLVKTSPRLLIYWDQQIPFDRRYQQLVDDIAAQLEVEVMPEVSRRLGTVFDTDGDGRFTILFTPWLDRLEGGKTSLRGMVRGTDFRDDVSPPFGHRCDMLYLNPLASPAVPWRDILLHEYTHAVCCSWRMQRGSSGKPLPIEDDWIQEGMAHTLEPLGANQSHRIAAFLATPQEFPLVIPDYYHAGLWRNDGCRGATALFHRWLTDRYGDAWLQSMMLAPKRGVQNIEAVTGCSFADLFRAWTIDVMNSVSPTPWNVDHDSPSFELYGTASSYWELTAETSTPRRIRIAGEPGCTWQMTLIPLRKR